MVGIQRGHVVEYRPSRGFGFIAPDHDCGWVFVRAQDVEDDNAPLRSGEVVEFHPELGLAGQLTAVGVRRRGLRGGRDTA